MNVCKYQSPRWIHIRREAVDSKQPRADRFKQFHQTRIVAAVCVGGILVAIVKIEWQNECRF